MIKVLHVFSRMNRGGAEMRTLELMPFLKSMDVHFDFCTMSPESAPLDSKIQKLGGEIYRCNINEGLFKFSCDFIKLLKRVDCNIVHSHVHFTSGYLMWLAKKAGVSGRIVHFRNTYDGNPNTILRRLQNRTKLALARKYATGVLAVCRGAMEAGWGIDWKNDDRAEILYNGLDLAPYDIRVDREKLLQELNIPSQSKIFIHVGRMVPQKNHQLLIRSITQVVRKNSSVHLLLVGDGILKTEIKQMIHRNQINNNVHVLGLREDVPQLLKASDFFVLPSKWEGLPGVLLEAIAARLPVIATDLPGVREIAKHTDLITIVPISNSTILAKTMLNKCEESYLCDNENIFPDTFSLELCAKKLNAFYAKQLKIT